MNVSYTEMMVILKTSTDVHNKVHCHYKRVIEINLNNSNSWVQSNIGGSELSSYSKRLEREDV